MSSATNPSAARQAREAQAEAIEELKHRNTLLAQAVDQLRTGLDEATKSNKALRKKVSSLQAAHEGLADQFENAQNKQKTLQKFKTRATKLLLALSAGHSVEELRNQVLAAAVSAGDPSIYLAALVGDGNVESEDEADTMEAEEDQARGAGQGATDAPGVPLFGGGGGGTMVVDQEKILGSSSLKVC
jgi:DNA repair exonuclease SbcCD ATPase subunit